MAPSDLRWSLLTWAGFPGMAEWDTFPGWPEAAHTLEEALALCQGMHTPYEEAKTLSCYGLLHRARGEPTQARERLEAALAILHRLGERLYAEQVERALAHLGPQEEQITS